MTTTNSPSTEERIFAALSHFSMLLSGIGVAMPLLAWKTQGEKSSYVRFQSLQALGWQILQSILFTLLGLVVGILGFLPLMVYSIDPPENGDPTALILWLAILIGCLILAILGYTLIAVIAGIKSSFGREPRYPKLADRLEPYLEAGGDHQDRWVCSMAHAAIMYPYFGWIVPAVAIINSKTHPFLRSQCLQALIYQLLGTGVVLFFSTFSSFMAVLLSIYLGLIKNPRFDTLPVMPDWMIIVLFFVMFVPTMIIFLLAPLYQTLPLVYAVQVLKGKTPKYPIIGKWVARFTPPPPDSSVNLT